MCPFKPAVETPCIPGRPRSILAPAGQGIGGDSCRGRGWGGLPGRHLGVSKREATGALTSKSRSEYRSLFLWAGRSKVGKAQTGREKQKRHLRPCPAIQQGGKGLKGTFARGGIRGSRGSPRSPGTLVGAPNTPHPQTAVPNLPFAQRGNSTQEPGKHSCVLSPPFIWSWLDPVLGPGGEAEAAVRWCLPTLPLQ